MNVGDRRIMCMVALVPNILRATVIDLEVALVPISKIRRLLNDVFFLIGIQMWFFLIGIQMVA